MKPHGEKVVDTYDGKLPVIIKAVPEGLLIPTKNVLLTIELTVSDPEVFSLVSYFETSLLRLWYPCTVATISNNIRETIKSYLSATSDNIDELPFKLHDFGSRGATTSMAAGFGAAAHLATGFQGSDTMIGVATANLAYHNEMSGFSVPASEHSTTTSWGVAGEEDFVDNMLHCYANKDDAIVSTVADSYNIENFCKNIVGDKFKDRIIKLHAKNNLTYVVRPDSNDPVKMPIQCIKWLAESFGTTTNSKGFEVINHGVRVLQGDGIAEHEVGLILEELKRLNFSASNMTFGMGGGLLQRLDRDTMKFAMKCCSIHIDGEWHDVYKNPVSMHWDNNDNPVGFKKSKAGRITLVYKDDYKTIRVEELQEYLDDGFNEVMRPVYKNGQLLIDDTFETIRNR